MKAMDFLQIRLYYVQAVPRVPLQDEVQTEQEVLQLFQE